MGNSFVHRIEASIRWIVFFLHLLFQKNEQPCEVPFVPCVATQAQAKIQNLADGRKRETQLNQTSKHDSCGPTLMHPDELTADAVNCQVWSTSIHTSSSARH